MQHLQISHNPELQKLRNEGYELHIHGGHISVHHIPYVTEKREVKYGILISELNLASPTTVGRPSHTMHFMGEAPCHKDGTQMVEIINSIPDQPLTDELIGNYYFSSKPASGYYKNYYDKFKRYIALLSVPARSIDSDATAATFRPYEDIAPESVFHYYDTNSSRANIELINTKFKGQKIGIIGLGGTGSYILDLVAKTPVSEIHLFDNDVFSQHNAFRSPGAPSLEELHLKQKKVTRFSEIYGRMHKGIIPHETYITEENIQFLAALSFVFICVDKNSVRNMIIQQLIKLKIPFIDTGLGVTLVDDQLIGIVRTTAGTPDKYDHIAQRIPLDEAEDNEYGSNIQIADLNALNALTAVIKWKKLNGFYQDLIEEHHSTYSINVAQLLHGDTAA